MPRRPDVRRIGAALAAALLATSAAAQANRGQPQPARPTPPAAPAPPPPEPPALYEKDLLRLAEILGALAFLRPLCGALDGPEWPKRMRALLDAESGSAERRDRLAGTYNRGYQSYALTYRGCTPSAEEATARFIREGETLSRTIATRYGG